MATTDTGLKKALKQWQNWHLLEPLTEAPHLGQRLGEGSGHVLYDIHSTLGLVARVRQHPKMAVAPDFEREMVLWKKAASYGLAPKIVYADSDTETVICVKADIPEKKPTGIQLGQLMSKIHCLPSSKWTLDLQSRIDLYLDYIPSQERSDWINLVLDPITKAAIYKLGDDMPFLCHNDLIDGNVMRFDDQFIAIDWEYAAMGSRYFDAAIAIESMADFDQKNFLETVFGDDFDSDLLCAGQYIARLVCALWQRVYQPEAAADPKDRSWLKRISL